MPGKVKTNPFIKWILCILFMQACFLLHAQDTTAVENWHKLYHTTGLASYYANKFHGRKTSNGERYSKHKLTAAHRTLPFGTLLKVTNIRTKKWVVVRVNDRGPYNKKRVVDLSYRAAKHLGMVRGGGLAKVKVEEIPRMSGPDTK